MSSCGKNAAHPWSQSDLRTLETEENIYWKISTEQIVFQTNKIWFLHHAPFDLYASMTQTCSSDLCFLQLLGTNSCPDVRQLRMRTVWKKKQKQRVIFWLSVLLLHWVDKLLIAKEQRKKKPSRQLPQHYQLRVFPLFTLRMTGHRTYSLLHTTVTVITADAWAKQSDTFQMSLFKTSRTSHQRERERQTLDTSQQRWELIRIYRFWFHY